jgi:16S rRNA (cytosine967-C5)-methyltransferase
MDSLAALGERLLAAAARLVRPGGFVVYSTCTIARRENENVIQAFLATDLGRGFSVDSLKTDVPTDWQRFVTSEGWFRSLPEPDGPDGHFVARLVRA